MKNKLFFLVFLLTCGILFACTNYKTEPVTSTLTAITPTEKPTVTTTTPPTTQTEKPTTTTEQNENINEAKQALKDELLLEFNKFDSSNYTVNNYQLIISIKNNALAEIENLNTIENVNNFNLSYYINEMKKVSMSTGDLPWV